MPHTFLSSQVPRILLKFTQELYDEAKTTLRKVPFLEQVPWWWWRDKSKPIPNIGGQLGLFRMTPDTIEPLSSAMAMALIGDYECLGLPIPRARKIFEAGLDSELASLAEQRKRDRLIAYSLVCLMGDFLVPLTKPEQQKPAHVLSMKISYPQFLEVIGTCMLMK